ncbi:DUF2589 domain-containing protein [Alcaligenaceae bacterium SJ-26]|nr:DUF2589 domain-containing protein [Alcaligenaceae bacterium SJ-26]
MGPGLPWSCHPDGRCLAVKLSLNSLIQGIASAVAQAQERIFRHQAASVLEYFDEQRRPRCVEIRLPVLGPSVPDAPEGDEQWVRVPLLSLVGARQLSIKDMEISFEVGLGNDAEPAPEQNLQTEREAASPWLRETCTSPLSLAVDLGGASNQGLGSRAKVTIRVESLAPTDGMARLIQQLDKQI